MNLPNKYYVEPELDYASDVEGRGGKEKAARSRKINYARAQRPAATHNGIHRRRNKRFAW